MLRRDGIEVGPDGSRAVRVGAAQREVHAPLDVLRLPQGLPVGGDAQQGAHPGAVRVRPTRPDMALVDVGVDVDEGRQSETAAHVEDR